MKAITKLFIAVLGIGFLLASLYLGIAFYYRKGFSFGTTVNGLNLTGMSMEEAEAVLLAHDSYQQIEVVDKNNETYTIALSDIGYNEDYSMDLDKIKTEYSPLRWGKNFIGEKDHVIEGTPTFDPVLLEQVLLQAPFMSEDKLYNVSNTIDIVRTGANGYQIQDMTKDLIHKDKAVMLVEDGIAKKLSSVNLQEGDCYESISVPTKEKDIKDLFEKIEKFQNFTLTYQVAGKKELIDSSVTSEWITLAEDGSFAQDENGDLILNEAAVRDYVASLAEKYNTKGTDRTFMSTSGKEIHFTQNQVLYGTTIDQNAETKLLIEEFKSGETGIEREPKYISKAYVDTEDGIGNTYIEINLTEQHLYFYKDGVVALESDFVSGNMRAGMGTPQLYAYVRNKAKNVTLRGPGYESFVYYWMGIWQGYGMHDATWRGKFGGEIYKTSGSHGCINLPLNFIKEFYEEVEVGMPLIMFYEPEPDAQEKAKLEEEKKKKAEEEAAARAQQQQQQPVQPAPTPQPEPQPEPQPMPQPQRPADWPEWEPWP